MNDTDDYTPAELDAREYEIEQRADALTDEDRYRD